jgi:hypothetical protein
LIAKKRDVKNAIVSQQPLYLLFCKEVALLANTPNTQNLPSCVETLLQEFEDMFPKEVPSGLPPIRGIEHHIDLNPGASLPNRPAYRSNPQQTQEIEKQVAELVSKGWVRESLSPCVVPVILVPKKDGSC